MAAEAPTHFGKDTKPNAIKDPSRMSMGVTTDQLTADLKQLEGYERQAKLADAQRLHLKVSLVFLSSMI